MIFNKVQQKMITDMINFEATGIENSFKDLLENILEKNFNKFGIEIKKDEVYISSKNVIEDKNKIYELFFLIEILIKNHLFRFIKTGKNIETYEQSYTYNIYNKDDLIKINFNNSIIRLIYYNLYSDYYITSNLKEIKKMKFKSIEEKNLRNTLIALWTSIIISGISFAVDWVIANKVTTVIEFAKPEQLQNASSTTIINIKDN